MKTSYGPLLLLCAVLYLVLPPPACGVEPDELWLLELFPDAVFDRTIPTQLDVLGFVPGERPVRHDELMRYLRALADASPRAELVPYTRSYEGRELVYLAVSDEETISRLDAFRGEHERRMDPRGRSAGQDAGLLKDAKAVAWIAYGIHGDELSSVDAAAAVAYWLVAGEDPLASRLRRDLVILIDPIENPDGRERYLAQISAFAHASPNPDVEDLSHTALWPWGRGNHYFFDLNRDWFSMVNPESERSTVIASWDPQLVVDSHEMGALDTYLFSPPRHPFNPHLPPSHFDWMERFAADQARALDARGYPYYTREWNEEFFPGYGSSWAAYRGAIGILYEMSETSGTLVRKREGTVRTYAQAVEHQVTSTLANLRTLDENRREILADFVADRRTAIEKGRRGPVGAWVLPERHRPERVRRLVRTLRKQGIEVYRSVDPSPSVRGLRDLLTGEEAPADGLDGPVWLVPLEQPAAPLVRAILDPHVPMEAEFLREEREYLERGKESRLYETTAWSLLLGYGLEAYWAPGLRLDGHWAETDIPEPQGSLEKLSEPFAYLIEGESDLVPSALCDLFQRGIQVRVAEKPFSVRGHSYEHGTLMIPREGNPGQLEEELAQIADRWGLEIHATPTAKAEDGPDLGGGYFYPLVPPRIGIWTGPPVAPSAYGALWYVMDEVLEMRFSALDIQSFEQKDLGRYNVLIFPPMWEGGGYRQILGDSGLDRLRRWIEAGGTAIGIGSGAEFLADVETNLTKTRLRRQVLDRYPPAVIGPGPAEAQEAGFFRAVGVPPSDKTGEEGDKGRGRKKGEEKGAGKARPVFKGSSPYDVAPVLGPGARPFAEGFDLGTPVEMVPVDLATWLKPYLPPGKDKPDKEDLERADERLRRFGPHGAFLRIELDPEVYLCWGLPREMPALIRQSDALMAEPPVQVAAWFPETERLHLGGLLWPEAAARLARTAYATREEVGRGQVILFLDDPETRGWTLATRRLLLNAILFGPGVGTRWSIPW